MKKNKHLGNRDIRWDILYGTDVPLGEPLFDEKSAKPCPTPDVPPDSMKSKTYEGGKSRNTINSKSGHWACPGWGPSKSDLAKIAGKRAETIRNSGHARAWARGIQIRYQRTRQGPTKPLCAPQHYKYDRFCETCNGVVLHPNEGGDLKRCMWDRDRERDPKLGGRGGVLVKPHIGPTLNELKRGWRNAKKR